MMRRLAALVLIVCASCVEDVDLGRDDLELRLVAGATTTCGVDAEGTVLCLGLGESGQLGIELDPDHATTLECTRGTCTTSPRETNVFVISDLAVSRDFACAILGDRTDCFGGTRYGQLGDGRVDDDPHPIPSDIDLFNAPLDVALGEAHGCVLYRDERVYCWGFGGHGQLGIAPETLQDCGVATEEDAARLAIGVGDVIRCQPVPVPVPSILDAVGLFVGAHGTCVVREGGELRCMGHNDVGQLGLAAGPDVTAPTASPLASAPGALTHLALGARHGCAIVRGSLRCFGSNSLGALGRDAPCAPSCGAERVAIDDVVDVAVGRETTWALDRHGRLFAFGDAREGALGREGTDDCDGIACGRRPRRVPLPRGVLAFAGGEGHVCAILSDLRTMCFGRGTEGQTGNTFLTSGPELFELVDIHRVLTLE